MEQLTIPDLFGAPTQSGKTPEECCIDWLLNTRHCKRSVVPIVHRLFESFGNIRGWERSKVLTSLSGPSRLEGWSLDDAEYIGLFDTSITDYHVLWDRNWAMLMQVPRELVPLVFRCKYGGRPKFYDRDGNLLFTSIFTDNGHMLTHEERKKALADRERGSE